MSATLVLPQPDLSAQRTLYVVEMPALHTWVQEISRMKNTKKAAKPTTPKTYRESILKPGAARIALTGRNFPCNPYLGGTADEACIFVNEAEARAEIATLATCSDNARVVRFWEIQTLRADGLWQGCVAAGEIPAPPPASYEPRDWLAIQAAVDAARLAV